jgi:hypothetical protein
MQSAATLFAALAACTLVACGSAESPSTVSKNVATAEQKEASHTDKALQDERNDIDKAQHKVDDQATKRNNVAAEDAYKVTVARADGDHDVAVHACKAQSGDAQRRCEKQADADYDAAKANAKALETSKVE